VKGLGMKKYIPSEWSIPKVKELACEFGKWYGKWYTASLKDKPLSPLPLIILK
jgi:hypothetical protein